jgi:hypothetical protein
MSKLAPQQLTISPSKFVEELKQAWQSLARLFNGGVSFGDGTNIDNISGAWVPALTVIGNFTVSHNLGRVPVGTLMVKTDAFENLKFVSATATQITLAGQNGGANVLLFVF